MKLALSSAVVVAAAMAVALGWIGQGAHGQSIRVTCKYKYSKSDYEYCTEGAGENIETGGHQKCIVSRACSRHAPIYEFTTLATNTTKECQRISKCMLDGGAKICNRRKPCQRDQDVDDCEEKPTSYESRDCLRLNNKRMGRLNPHRWRPE